MVDFVLGWPATATTDANVESNPLALTIGCPDNLTASHPLLNSAIQPESNNKHPEIATVNCFFIFYISLLLNNLNDCFVMR
jgi:hypothetical protein